MTDMIVSHREMRLAETVSHNLSQAFTRRKLQPAFSSTLVTNVDGMTLLIAVLDTTSLGDHSPYTNPLLLHQLSTDLGGTPVYLSNSTGIRYVVLLSSPPKLPRKVELPKVLLRRRVYLGVRFSGQVVDMDLESMLHMAVLGMTGSGKSVFLQSLVYQARINEMKVLLSDIDQTTFSMLEGSPDLLAPIAASPKDAFELVERAIQICDERAELFKQMAGHPSKLSEYNSLAAKQGREPLNHILVVLDEASSVLTSLGGAKGAMGQALATLGWRGRKFGVHFVFAAQEFTKDIVGPIRDQVGLTLCFRVRNGMMAERMGCKGAGRIPEGRPGLAISDRHGPIQTYFVDKSLLGQSQNVLPIISPEEHDLLSRSLRETDGRLSIPILVGWGTKERLARQLLAAWELLGWAVRDPQRDNARYITPKLALLLSNRQTGQAASNRQ